MTVGVPLLDEKRGSQMATMDTFCAEADPAISSVTQGVASAMACESTSTITSLWSKVAAVSVSGAVAP